MSAETNDSWSTIGRDAKDSLIRTLGPMVILLAAMWAIQLVNALGGYWLNGLLGLEPRSLSGLLGILFMPLLHGGWMHLISNSLSWIVLASMTAIISRDFLRVTAGIWLLGGALLWVGGTSGVHVGASGLIYGFTAFMLVYGWVKRRPLAILFALIVAVFHGVAMLPGLLPGQPNVSWTGHLFSACAGVVVALWRTRELRAQRQVRKAENARARLDRR